MQALGKLVFFPMREVSTSVMSTNSLIPLLRHYFEQFFTSLLPLLYHNLPQQHHSEIEASIQQIGRWSAIIESMTQFERENPSVIFEGSRIESIAHGSGTTVKQVEDFVNRCVSNSSSVQRLLEKLVSSLVLLKQENSIRFDNELCEKTHANIMAGTCPWCGREISGWEMSGNSR